MHEPTEVRRPGRRAQNEARRREEILAAAATLFASRGYTETDTQVLVDQLHIGKGTLYRYFPSKCELFLATVDRAMRRMRECIDTRIADVQDPLDQIAEAIHAYLAFFAEHPEFVELLIQERAQFRDRKKPTYFEQREANIGRWHDLYRKLIAAGRIREMPVERITDVLGNLVYGTMFTNYFTGAQKSFAEQAQEILDVVFHGILTEAERQKRPVKP